MPNTSSGSAWISSSAGLAASNVTPQYGHFTRLPTTLSGTLSLRPQEGHWMANGMDVCGLREAAIQSPLQGAFRDSGVGPSLRTGETANHRIPIRSPVHGASRSSVLAKPGPWLKPNAGKPRERGYGSGRMPRVTRPQGRAYTA